MSNDDITKFLDAPRRKGRPRVFPPEVLLKRRTEVNRRANAARKHAYSALTKAYPDDWKVLYAEALRRVNAEGGPLPGDPE